MQQSTPPCLLSLAQIAPDFSVSSSVRYCIDLSFSTQHWVQLFTIQVLPRKHRCISNLPNDFPDKLPLRCSFLTEKWMRLKLRVRQETASLPVSGWASVSGSRVHCSDWVCHTVTPHTAADHCLSQFHSLQSTVNRELVHSLALQTWADYECGPRKVYVKAFVWWWLLSIVHSLTPLQQVSADFCLWEEQEEADAGLTRDWSFVLTFVMEDTGQSQGNVNTR